jgi:D-lactate dehydrogenase
MALDTCAADGLCATACPVSIDTGLLVKKFRHLRHTSVANNIALLISKYFSLVEFGARVALTAGHTVQSIFGLGFMRGITGMLNKITRATMGEAFWQWCAEMPYARRGKLPVRPAANAQAVYFPACISRMMGALPGEDRETSVMQALLNVADRAGVNLYVPSDIKGNCCGVPFSSKGFESAHNHAVDHTIENFFRWSNGGELPIVVDTSPCTYGLRGARSHLKPENQVRFEVRTRPPVAHAAHSPQGPLRRIAPGLFRGQDGHRAQAGEDFQRLQ